APPCSTTNGGSPAGAAGQQANLIRVLKATVKGPQRGSQHPAYQRPPTTKDIRRQRATTPIFTQERAPPAGRHRGLSAIEGSPLCGPPFSQVTAERQGQS